MPNKDMVVLDFDGTLIKGNLHNKINLTFIPAKGAENITDSISMLEQGKEDGKQWMNDLIEENKDITLVDGENLLIFLAIVPKRETGDPVSASCILIVVSLVPVANTTPRPS